MNTDSNQAGSGLSQANPITVSVSPVYHALVVVDDFNEKLAEMLFNNREVQDYVELMELRYSTYSYCIVFMNQTLWCSETSPAEVSESIITLSNYVHSQLVKLVQHAATVSKLL